MNLKKRNKERDSERESERAREREREKVRERGYGECLDPDGFSMYGAKSSLYQHSKCA